MEDIIVSSNNNNIDTEENLEELIKYYVNYCSNSDINVYGYIRVSTEKQVREGYSLGGQIRSIGKYCRSNGLNLVNIFKDEGISGAKADEYDEVVDRQGIQDLMAGLKRDDIKYVVVLNTARLWRSDIAKFLIQRELRRYKVDVKSIENPNYSLYTEDPSSFLMFNILCPEMTLQQIADRLNMMGKRTKRGKLFTAMTVKRVLDKMLFYMGYVYVDGKWMKGRHPPILE